MKKRLFTLIALLILSAAVWKFGNPFSSKSSDHFAGVKNRTAVERAIDRKVSGSRKFKAAAYEYARTLQMAIEFPEQGREIVRHVIRAGQCLKAMIEQEGGDEYLRGQIESFVVDTWTRSSAYAKYNGKLSGMTFDSEPPDAGLCAASVLREDQ